MDYSHNYRRKLAASHSILHEGFGVVGAFRVDRKSLIISTDDGGGARAVAGSAGKEEEM